MSNQNPPATATAHLRVVGNRVEPIDPGESMPAALRQMEIVQDGDRVVANIPALATGSMAKYGNTTDTTGPWDNAPQWDGVAAKGNPKRLILQAIDFWRWDPIVYKCVSLLAKWSNTRVKIICDDEDTKHLFKVWMDQAMPFSFREAFFLEYFRTGYIPIFKTLIRYVPRNYKPAKIPQPFAGNVQAVAEEQDLDRSKEEADAAATKALIDRDNTRMQELVKAYEDLGRVKSQHQQGLASQQRVQYYENVVASKQAEWAKGFLPGSYTILDPLQVDIEGPKEMPWLRQPYLNISPELVTAITRPTPAQLDVVNKLPADVVRQVRGSATKIALPANICTVVFGDKQPYEQYSTPIVSHCADALRRKRNLQVMDDQTIASIKNRILLVKIGTDTYPVWDKNELGRLKQEFLSAGASMVLFWNHTISMEFIEPDMKSLTDPTKFETVNEEIRTPFGVNSVLTGTASNAGSIGNNQMNFKGVQVTTGSAQGKFCEFANAEFQLVRMALGITHDARAEMEEFNLEDEAKWMSVILQMYMNGVIDHITTHEELGYDTKTIEKNMAKLKKLRDKSMFLPTPSANNLGQDSLDANNKPGGAGGSPTGGKPANQPGADNNSSRTGTGKKPTKVAATIQNIGDVAYLVYDGDTLPEDYMQDVLKAFGTDDHSRFITASRYKEITGSEVDFSPAWPQLTPKEVSQAAMAAVSLQGKIDQAAAQEVERVRQQATGGKRAYLTEEAKKEIAEKATSEVGMKYLQTSASLTEKPSGWDRHFRAVCQDVDLDMKDESHSYRRALAYVVCTKRFKKAPAPAPAVA